MKIKLVLIILLSLAMFLTAISVSSISGDGQADSGAISDQYNNSNVRCDDPESVNLTPSHLEGKIPVFRPTANQAGENIIVTSGGNLDRYLYWPSTIEFDMKVTTANSKISSGQLTLSIWDVDQFCGGSCYGTCEVDPVYLNDHYLGTLTGADSEWSTTTFILDPSWINGADNGSPGVNHVKIVIDSASHSCWAVECDWGQMIINSGEKGNAKIVSISSDKQAYSPGDTISSIISLTTDQESQFIKLETNLYNIYGQNVDGHTSTLTLHKDATTRFSQQLFIPANVDSGDFNIEAIAYSSSFIQQDKKSKIITVSTIPDLYILNQDISFLKINTVPGGLEVKAEAAIHYENDDESRNVDVRFYDEDATTGKKTQINSQSVYMHPGINNVPIVWTPSSRQHNLCVIIDPNNKIKESDETNNAASNSLKGPVIFDVTSKYTGYFLSLFQITNVYIVRASEDVEYIEFSMNGETKKDEDGSDGWSMEYDMGSLPSPSELIITAFDSAKMPSQPYIVKPQIAMLPEWMEWIISKGNHAISIQGNTVTYKLKDPITIPNPPLSVDYNIPAWIPLVNGPYKFDVSSNFGFEANSKGLATVSGGGEAATKIDGGDGTIGITLEGVLRFLKDLHITLNLESASLKISGSVTIPGPKWEFVLPIPFYGNLGVTVGTRLIPGIDSALEFVEDPSGALIAGLGWKSSEGTISSALEGFAKLPISTLGKIEATLGGKPSLTFKVPKPYFKEVAVDLYAKLKASCGWMEWNGEFRPPGLPWSYPSSNYMQNKLVLASSTGWEPIPRDYAAMKYSSFAGNGADSRKMKSGIPGLNSLAVQENLLVENVFPYASPSIAIDENDNMTMVWCHDDINKPQANGFEIYYSTWHGGLWNIPSPVTNNFLPEFRPVVQFDKNGNSIAMWILFNNTSISADTSIFSVLGDAELEYSVLNKTTGLWCTPKALTHNSVFEDYLTLSKDANDNVAATWVVDKDNNLTTDSDRDIYYSIWNGLDWTEPKAIAENVKTNAEPALAYSPGKGVCVWSADTDSNSTTMEDRELSYATWNGIQWSNPESLTNDGIEDAKPKIKFNKLNDIILTWIKRNETNDSIYVSKYDNSWSSPELVAESTTIYEMDLSFDARNNAVVVWQGASMQGQDIFYAVRDESNKIWRSEKQLTNDTAAEWQLSTAIDSNEELVVSYVKKNMTIVNYTYEEGNSDLYYLVHPIMPDVALDSTDIVFSDENAFPGDQITINATIHNIGDLKADSVKVVFNDGIGGPQIGAVQTLPSIPAGQNATISAIWNIPAQQQSHDIYVEIDQNNDITESNESNNMAFRSTVLPDLEINESDITYCYRQKSLMINTTVSNSGVIPVSNILVELFDNGTNGILINATTVAALSPNNNETISTMWDVAGIDSGRHDIYVVVDRLDEIQEQNETNNIGNMGIMILPDLALNANNVSISETSEGNATIEAVISNIGVSVAENATIEVFDGNASLNGVLIGNATIETISPESNSTIDFDWNATAGQHDIYVQIDPHNEIQELDRANNLAMNQVIISPGSDLVINSKDIAFSAANGLGQVTISALIHNTGPADAPGTTVGFYNGTPDYSQTNPYKTYIPNLLGTEAVPPIASHDSVKVNLTTAWIPESDKSYDIYAFADPKNCIHEISEANNLEANSYPNAKNLPPDIPSMPSGATLGTIGTTYDYSTSAIDPDGDMVDYTFDWDDGTPATTTNQVSSGATANATHSWNAAGEYHVKAMTTDSNGEVSDWSDPLTVVINTPPNIPSVPAGTKSGYAWSPYSFSTSATDPNGDQVKYTFDWGDGTSSTTSLVDNGKMARLVHTWKIAGTYQLKAMSTDDKGATSGWSRSLSIKIDKNNPPKTPTLTGTKLGTIGTTYVYLTSAIDPNGDKVKYTFDWGDGTTSTTQLLNSGAKMTLSHRWTKAGTYVIKVIATDAKGSPSLASALMNIKITDAKTASEAKKGLDKLQEARANLEKIRNRIGQ